MARSDLSLKAQIWKFWEIHLFWTPHNFAYGPHFVALTQLWPTKTWYKTCCTHLSNTFWNPECKRIPLGLPPKNFPLKIFGYGAFYQKNHFFDDFRVLLPNKTKLEFDWDFKSFESFELKVLISQSTHCPGSVVPLTMCQYDPLLK